EKLVMFDEKIYLPTIFYAEHKSADEIYRILKHSDDDKFTDEEVNEQIKDIEQNENIKYNSEQIDRKSTRLNSSHVSISYAVFCLKQKRRTDMPSTSRDDMRPQRLV